MRVANLLSCLTNFTLILPMNIQLDYYSSSSDKEGSSNTPQKIPTSDYTVKFDWLTLLGDLNSPDALDKLIEDVFDIFTDKFTIQYGTFLRGRPWDGGYAESQYGIQLVWDDLYGEKTPRFRLAIPGRGCSRIGVLDMAMFVNGLNHAEHLGNIECTRLDAAFDDWTKSLFTQQDIYDAWQNDSIVRLYNRTHTMYTSGSPSDEYGLGWSHTWGRGRKIIQFYNKAAESKGAIDSHRIEVRYKEKDANKAFQLLKEFPLSDFEEFCVSFLSGLVAGMVDFMKFPKGRNHGVRDGIRLAWWQRVLDVQEGMLRFSTKPPKQNLKRKLDWIKRQVVTSLAQVSDVVGNDRYQEWLSDCVKAARQKYKDIHKAFIHTTKLEFQRGIYADIGD